MMQNINDKKEGTYGEVSLEEMLAARERRAAIQARLTASHQTPLISFTLNIPGPVKVLEGIPGVFGEGCEKIRHCLASACLSCTDELILREKTGYEAFFCIPAAPEAVKRLTAPLEEETALGRLYDIDVIRTDGRKVSREEIGLPPRTCLLCGRPAHECSRSRSHSVEELVARIRKLIREPENDPAGKSLTDRTRSDDKA